MLHSSFSIAATFAADRLKRAQLDKNQTHVCLLNTVSNVAGFSLEVGIGHQLFKSKAS